MAKQTMIQADPDVLGKAATRAADLAAVVSANFKEMDESLEELRLFWVGSQSDEFYEQFETARAAQEDAVKQLNGFCSEAFAAVPVEYGKLEGAIKAEVQKLVASQS